MGAHDSVDVDLDQPPDPELPEARRPPVGVVWLVAGLVVGGAVVHAFDLSQRQPSLPSSATQPVRVALGAFLAHQDLTPVGPRGTTKVIVPAVVTNEGPTPITIRSVQAVGPGAGLTLSIDGIQPSTFPMTVQAGQTKDLAFGLTSNCAVAVRPVPRVVLSVAGQDGALRQVDAVIPDLDRLWGQMLQPDVCRGS